MKEPVNITLTRYFAIGAMMNPVSVRLRNIHPRSSRPAKLFGHQIHFFGERGMAEVIVAPEHFQQDHYDDEDTTTNNNNKSVNNACMHGVLHEILPQEMSLLDDIEMGYDKKSVTVELYDGTTLDNAFVYCRHGDNIQRGPNVDQPPSERYLQILVEGAQAHGVDLAYTEYLKNHKCIPRTKPQDYQSFDLPPLLPSSPTHHASSCCRRREYSLQEIQAADGKDGRDFLITLNGKVLKCICDDKTVFPVKRWIQFGINHLEPYTARILYDPMFGEPPENLEDFSKDYCDSVEDTLCRFLESLKGGGGAAAANKDGNSGSAAGAGAKTRLFECVGIFAQRYKETK